ncbi:MAG: 30S ribosomal protein S2 [Nitrososphaerales archaeon]
MSKKKTNEEERDEEGSVEKSLAGGQLTEKALIATGIRVGTLQRTKYMENFIQKVRPEGTHIIDINKTLQRIDIAGKFIARHDPKRVVLYSSKEHGKMPVTKFCELTGAIPLLGRFMPGTFTNPLFPGHLDPELLIVSDPAMDYQAIDEAVKVGIPIIAVCDTDSITTNIDLIIPANNRGRKALAAVFWLLARAVLIHRGELGASDPMKYTIEDFETKLEE